ncbi:MAG TPA: ATP-binding protein [Marinobacterium sp.]|nr:ATP-binding protein [Marinobacterium sp.]
MIGFWSKLRDRVLPQSILARMTLILLVGILLAQVMSAVIWNRQLEESERTRLTEVSQVMGVRIGQTLEFFSRLPKRYRHIVLDQLRDMGGTRFFVSVNRQYLELKQLPENELQALVRDTLVDNLRSQFDTNQQPVDVRFVSFDDLRILNNRNLMVELPPKWQSFALLNPGDNSPAVVVQLPLGEQEWIYLATVFPEGRILAESVFNAERMLSVALVTLTAALLTLLLVAGIVRPLRRLAKQADALGRGQTMETIPVEGTREMQTTIRAFNQMSQRIEKYISDRERLFASISHDLKTPLTRARLRAELIDDEALQEALTGDLENLEALVKASLQMIKDGAIHENSEPVNLKELIERCLNSAKIEDLPCRSNIIEDLWLNGRPLSLERLFTNLIDNALHYGRAAEVNGWREETELVIAVCDRGPGISEKLKERVFEPFFRIDKAPTSVHVGLGMGIVRSIAQLHGASIELKDRYPTGLIVELRFPL